MHHAGLVPVFKEIVERCFIGGLIKVVFATETLALGVNMPARSVIIEKLKKYDGRSMVSLTPAEYAQMSGRAGRRGIDDQGHAIVLWSPTTRFHDVASLAGSRSFRLESAFRPTYNMAVTLLNRMPPERARDLIERSFSQYQNRSTSGDSLSPRLSNLFDSVVAVLRQRGHLKGWDVTDSGNLLEGIYHESDLVITDAITAGIFEGLEPVDLGALLSCFIYERRQAGPPPKPVSLSPELAKRVKAISTLVREVRELERGERLPLTKPVDDGFTLVIADWVKGSDLEVVLASHEHRNRNSRNSSMSPGEFVRNVKQIVDLARRIAVVAPGASVAESAKQLAIAANRGVVALSGKLDMGTDNTNDGAADNADDIALELALLEQLATTHD